MIVFINLILISLASIIYTQAFVVLVTTGTLLALFAGYDVTLHLFIFHKKVHLVCISF